MEATEVPETESPLSEGPGGMVPPPTKPKRSHHRKPEAGTPPRNARAGSSNDSSTGSEPPKRGRPPREAVAAKVGTYIRDGYTARLAELGALLLLVRPVTGAVMIARAEIAANSLANLAMHNARIAKLLVNFLTVLESGDVALVGASLVVAHGVDKGRIPRDSMLTLPIQDVLMKMPVEPEVPDGGQVDQ